jgi:hypothetical protein
VKKMAMARTNSGRPWRLEFREVDVEKKDGTADLFHRSGGVGADHGAGELAVTVAALSVCFTEKVEGGAGRQRKGGRRTRVPRSGSALKRRGERA